MRHVIALVLVLGSTLLQAQAPSPRFDVASVRPNLSGSLSSGRQTDPGGRVSITNEPLRDLIRAAYEITEPQLVGGPGWLSERFDITAQAEAGAPPVLINAMLRTLLTERFALVTRRETRELPVYFLVAARANRAPGPRLRPRPECTNPDGSPVGSSAERKCGGARFAPGMFDAFGIPIAQFAPSLIGPSGRLVIDRTGLTGSFDIGLKYAPDRIPDASRLPADVVVGRSDDASLFTALEEQLGLKLEAGRAPVEVIVIDSVQRPAVN
jgi:uncharacterized protein (TIGR03435 family)